MAPFAAQDFGFAYNLKEFADTVLRLEVVAQSDSALAIITRKRPRSQHEDGSSAHQPINLSKRQSFDERLVSTEERMNKSEIAELNGNGSVSGIDNPMMVTGIPNKPLHAVDREGALGESVVKEIFVSSLILASESSYFKQLFGNGMRKSKMEVVTVQLTEEEADAFEELIVYMYKRTFNNTEPSHLLRVLMAADKYQVTSALIFSAELMLGSESAVMYLDFDGSNSASMDASMKPVKDAAGDFLVKRFKEVGRYEKDLLKMPISAIKSIFASSELEAPSEDYIYRFLVKWACVQYADENERRAVFESVLLGLIRVVHMSLSALQKFADCNLMPNSSALMLMTVNALLHKINSSYRPVPDWNYDQRAYLIKPLRFTCLDTHPEAVVFMELTLKDCIRMTTSGNVNSISSEVFLFAGRMFILKSVVKLDPVSKLPATLGFFVGVNQPSQPLPVANFDIVFSVRQNPAAQFVTKAKFSTNFIGGNVVGNPDIFSCSFAQLIGEGSPFLIGGRLHFRAELRIKQP